MKKIIISGGPHTGKTTLLNALRNQLAGVYFVPEPATEVITAEYLKEKSIEGYVGKFPWNNYPEFGELVTQKSLELEAQIPSDVAVAILDRSLIDTVAYAQLNDCDFMLAKLNGHIEEAAYDKVFFCDFVGRYTQTENRSESSEEAAVVHQMLKNTYLAADVDFYELGAVSVAERIKTVKENL